MKGNLRLTIILPDDEQKLTSPNGDETEPLTLKQKYEPIRIRKLKYLDAPYD